MSLTWPTRAEVNELVEVHGDPESLEVFMSKMMRHIAAGTTPFKYRLYALAIAQTLIRSDVECHEHFLPVMNLFKWTFHEFESPPDIVTETIGELNRCTEAIEL